MLAIPPCNKLQGFLARKCVITMAKKSRGARMVRAKKRAAKHPKGRGRVRHRPAGRKIMRT
jgi:hypothetical protein